MAGSSAQFTTQFQRELLVLLLKDPAAYSTYHDIWSPSYFSDHDHVRIATAFLKIRAEGEHPTEVVLKQELLKDCDMKNIPQERVKLLQEVDIIYAATPQNQKYSYKIVREFAQNQALAEAIGVSIDLLRAGEFEKVRPIIDNALAVGSEMLTRGLMLDNTVRDPSKLILDPLNARRISVGMPTLDALIGGGLAPGEMLTVAGGAGTFKSGTMVNWTIPALKAGLRITYVSLEMSEQLIYKRYCCNISDMPANTLQTNPNTFDQKFNQRIISYLGNLKVQTFGTYTLDIAGLQSYLERLEHEGHKTDVLVVDYPQIMRKNPTERNNYVAIGDLYCGIRMIASEHDCAAIVAAQGNRESVKNPEKFGMAEISSTMETARISDYIVGILRGDDDPYNFRLKLVKNRNDSTGVLIKMEMHYDKYQMIDRGEDTSAQNAAATSTASNSNQNNQQARQQQKAVTASNISSLLNRNKKP